MKLLERSSSLYCDENNDSITQNEEEKDQQSFPCSSSSSCFSPSLQLSDLSMEAQSLWEESELEALLEKQTQSLLNKNYLQKLSDPSSMEAIARREAIFWTLKAHGHYGFNPVTAILSIWYLDRFLSANQLPLQHDKPWMTQLVAVACLSLAAKMEETEVPLLLDLQVEDARFVFEPKTIQRMELLVLSTLGWRMTTVNALSFLNHAAHVLRLRDGLHLCLFIRKCQDLLLNALTDSKILGFLPSVVAVTVMLYVLREQTNEEGEHVLKESILLSAIKADKEDCKRCMRLLDTAKTYYGEENVFVGSKRKRIWDDPQDCGSPFTVLDTTSTLGFTCNSLSSKLLP